MAGACATILKAAFDGRVQFNTLPDGAIMTANENGHSLVYYTGSGCEPNHGEINKLASNIGQAQDFVGIHWRSDYEWGLRLGEAAAISVLSDQSNNYVGEDFAGFYHHQVRRHHDHGLSFGRSARKRRRLESF